MKVTITIDDPALTEKDVDVIEQIIDNRFGYAFDMLILVEDSGD